MMKWYIDKKIKLSMMRRYYYDNSIAGLRLCRRTSWWCRSNLPVTASNIPLRQATSPSQIRDSFQFEDVGLVCADPGSDTYADYRCDFELWDCETGIFVYLGCNLESPVFSNTAVRAALTHAINRDYLTEHYYGGFARGVTLPASPQSPYYNTVLARRYGYEAGVLKQAVDGAMMTDWQITLLVNSDDSMRLRTARAIVQMLSECGLFIELDPQDTETFYRKLRHSEYDLYLGQTRLSPNMDLSPFFGRWGNMSMGGIYNEDLYALCKDALANRGNYYNLLKAVADDGRICPILFSGYFVYADRGLVTDLSPSRDNVFYYTLGKTMEGCKLDTIYN